MRSSPKPLKLAFVILIIFSLLINQFAFAGSNSGSSMPTIGGNVIGGGSVSGKAGGSTSIGNSSVDLGGGASAGVEICMPGIRMPEIPDFSAMEFGIDITKPRIPIPYINVSLEGAREFYWEQINAYKAWLNGFVGGLTSQVKGEVCSIIQYARYDAQGMYNQMRAGALESLTGYTGGVSNHLHTSKQIELNYSRHSIEITERLVEGIDDFADNDITRVFYPSDESVQQLRRRYLGEIESKVCDYNNTDHFNNQPFGKQPYDKRLSALESLEFEFSVNLLDISALIDNIMDTVTDEVMDMVEEYFGGLIASAVAGIFPPVCFTILVACFCVDFFSNLPTEKTLGDAFEELADRLMNLSEKTKSQADPLTGSVKTAFSKLGEIASKQSEDRSDYEDELLERVEDNPPDEEGSYPTTRAKRFFDNAKEVVNLIFENPSKMQPYTLSDSSVVEPYIERFNPGYTNKNALPWIPDNDTDLWRLHSTSILRMYQQSRFAMKEYLSGAAIRALANEIVWMEQAKELLDNITDAVGDLERTGNIKQDILNQRFAIDIERKILESSLRQEVLLSIIIIAKRGFEYSNE